MDNLFQYFMYRIFGRTWIMHLIREGSKQAIFAMAIDVEQYFKKLQVADQELLEAGDAYEALPKTGLSPEGTKKLESAKETLDNAKMNFDMISAEYNRRSNELIRARERLEHVLETSHHSIVRKYGL